MNTLLTIEKQKKKFEKLQTAQSVPHQKQLDPSRVVINKSKHQLDDATISVLAKGSNFAITPRHIPVEKIICGVETAILGLPETVAEKIRQDTSVILRKSIPPASNISMAEMKALKTLRDREDIIVLPADKGNATVVLDSGHYKEKMRNILNDPAYIPTDRDPTVYLEKKTKTLIKASRIDHETQKRITPQEKSSRVPKLYGLPKVHKEGLPLRPIVSAVNSPTQGLARYLAKILQPKAELARSYVKNSTHFVQILRDLVTEPGDLLVSFDVVSLFTKIPVEDALQAIDSKHKPEKHVMDLVRHCMTSTYFVYDKQFYKQIKGAPMGSPLSPVVANLYLDIFELKAIDSARLKPRCWLRYVDDTFVIWQHGRDKLKEFLDHLNKQHESIQFTMEIEKNNKLPFLDVLVYRKPDYSLGHTVYRKLTHTDRYLHATSHHHPSQIRSVANTLATRSRRIADSENLGAEARYLHKALAMNGFSNRVIHQAWNRNLSSAAPAEEQAKPTMCYLPYVKGTTDRIGKLLARENIKAIFNTDKKIGDLLRNTKDRICLEGKGVYEVPCENCEHTYVGQTGRNMSMRQKEHRLAVQHNTKTSSLAQHVAQTKHTINFDGMRSLVSVDHMVPRLIREAIEIEKRPHNMNKRDDSRCLPVAWRPILASRTIKPTMRLTASQPNAPIGPPIGPITANHRPYTRSQAIKEKGSGGKSVIRNQDTGRPPEDGE